MQQDLIKESYECGGRGSYATAGHTLRLNDSTRPPPPPPPRIWRHNRSKSESRCLFYFYVYSMCVCVFFAWCKASSSHTHARRGNRGGNEREAEQLPPPPVPLDRPYRERESPYCAASTMADIGMHNWSRNNNKERKKKKLYLLICAPIRPSDGREREWGEKKEVSVTDSIGGNGGVSWESEKKSKRHDGHCTEEQRNQMGRGEWQNGWESRDGRRQRHNYKLDETVEKKKI